MTVLVRTHDAGSMDSYHVQCKKAATDDLGIEVYKSAPLNALLDDPL